MLGANYLSARTAARPCEHVVLCLAMRSPLPTRRHVPEPLQAVYDRLNAIGIDRRYVVSVALPAGWDDSAAENPAVFAQALTYLSRNLNLDIRSLQDPTAAVTWRDCGKTRFLKHKDVTEDDVTVAKCLSVRAAQIGCAAVRAAESSVPASAAEVRDAIRGRRRNIVDLSSVLDYCWNTGVPVMHVAALPKGAKKPSALAVRHGTKAAIVLCSTRRYAAWVLFWVVHELGHIAKKHLADDGVVVDQTIERTSTDQYEQEANAFGLEVLTGKPDVLYQAPYTLSGQDLAESARRVGLRDGIDPGVIALNYAWNQARFDIGNNALGVLEAGSDPIGLIRAKMCERLDWSALTRDNREFLRKITGTDTTR